MRKTSPPHCYRWVRRAQALCVAVAAVAPFLLLAMTLAASPGCANAARALPTADELLGSTAGDTGPGASGDSSAGGDSGAAAAAAPARLRASLEGGRQRLQTACTECHAVPYPQTHAASEWPALVEGMRRRANLTRVEADDVTVYLIAASRKLRSAPSSADREPLPDR